MKQSTIIFLVLFSLLIPLFTSCVDAQFDNPDGKLRGENATLEQGENDLDRYTYTQGKLRTTHKRSLRAAGNTRATMTINSFVKGGDGGGQSKCDVKYHSNQKLIVALATRWYDHGKRCFKFINICYNDKSVQAMVIDECDSNRGCDDDIFDASNAVWQALQVSTSEWGKAEITWSDA